LARLAETLIPEAGGCVQQAVSRLKQQLYASKQASIPLVVQPIVASYTHATSENHCYHHP
jgi:hypothetical protein